MIFLDLIDLDKIRKAILYLLCIAVTLWLQTAVFSRIAVLGVKPMFVPVIVVAIGLWEGGVWGAVLGLVTGVFCDMAYTGVTALFLVLFAAYGFFSGVLAIYFINRRFVAYLILAAAALALTAAVQIVPLWFFRGASPGGLFPVAGLQAAWSLPFAVPAYFAAKAISGRAKIEG